MHCALCIKLIMNEFLELENKKISNNKSRYSLLATKNLNNERIS